MNVHAFHPAAGVSRADGPSPADVARDGDPGALPAGWEARPRFDGGWTLARTGRARQALAIRWAALALATLTGAVFLFGHEFLEIVGRGVEPIGLGLLGTGLATIAWLERRGPAYRLHDGRIERRSGLGGRRARIYESPSLVLTGAGDEGWSLVLRHDHVPEILASGLDRDAALALAGFIAHHSAARVDLPEALERHRAAAAGEGPDAPADRTGTHG